MPLNCVSAECVKVLGKQTADMLNQMRRYNKIILFLNLILAGGIIVVGFVYAWTNPGGLPPAGGGSLITDLGGNIGIGVAVPSYKLDVTGDVRWTGILQGGSVPWARVTGFTGDTTSDTIADDDLIALGTETSGSYDTTADTIADDGVIADSEASDIITINNGLLYAPTAGNVGVGTIIPGYKLDVSGSANATQLCIGGDCKSTWPPTTLQFKGLYNSTVAAVCSPCGSVTVDAGKVAYIAAWFTGSEFTISSTPTPTVDYISISTPDQFPPNYQSRCVYTVPGAPSVWDGICLYSRETVSGTRLMYIGQNGSAYCTIQRPTATTITFSENDTLGDCAVAVFQ